MVQFGEQVLQVGGAAGRVRGAGGAGRGAGGTIRGAGGTVRGAGTIKVADDTRRGTSSTIILGKRKLGLIKGEKQEREI